MRIALTLMIFGLLMSFYILAIVWIEEPPRHIVLLLKSDFIAGLAISIYASLRSRRKPWIMVSTIYTLMLFAFSLLPIYAGHGSTSVIGQYGYHRHSFWEMGHVH